MFNARCKPDLTPLKIINLFDRYLAPTSNNWISDIIISIIEHYSRRLKLEIELEIPAWNELKIETNNIQQQRSY